MVSEWVNGVGISWGKTLLLWNKLRSSFLAVFGMTHLVATGASHAILSIIIIIITVSRKCPCFCYLGSLVTIVERVVGQE